MPMEVTMTTVELVYFSDCPNVSAAREQIRLALSSLRLAPIWTEHDVASANTPLHARGYGSPTILVDGRDVAGETKGDGASCRVYPGSEIRGVPALETVIAALRASRGSQPP